MTKLHIGNISIATFQMGYTLAQLARTLGYWEAKPHPTWTESARKNLGELKADIVLIEAVLDGASDVPSRDIVSPNWLRALVAGAYQDVTAQVPLAPELHEISTFERERLVQFAAAVLRRHGAKVTS